MVVSAIDHARTPPSSFPPKAEGAETSVAAPASVGGQQNARYFSPYIQFDHELGLAIIQYRDANTGSVIRQVPSKQVVDEYRARSSERDSLGSAEAGRTQTRPEGAVAAPGSGSVAGPDSVGHSSPGIAVTHSNSGIAAEQPKGGGKTSDNS